MGLSKLRLFVSADKFMMWIAAREESTIVVACHSGFLLNVFNSALEFDESQVDTMGKRAKCGQSRSQ